MNKYREFLIKVSEIESKNEFDFTVISFVNYFLELENAMDSLIKSKNSIGMMYILRGKYEVFLQFRYLIEHYSDFDKCNQRAKCYLYFHLLQERDWYKKLDKKEDIKRLNEKILSYADIETEYKKAEKRSKYPSWFTLFDGPSNFAKLEEHLGHKNKENHLYALASQICHGKTIIRNMVYDIYDDIEVWKNISDCLFSEFSAFLLPFAINHKIDVKDFAAYLITQIKDETEKANLQVQYTNWCKAL